MAAAPDPDANEIALLRRSLADARAEEAAVKERVRRLSRALGVLENPRRMAIAEDRLEVVRIYLQRESPARQSDISRETGYNPGTISVALRTMHEAGEARMAGKANRSQVWEWIGEQEEAEAPARKPNRRTAKATNGA